MAALDTNPTGSVFIQEFDLGVAERLGAVAREGTIASLGFKRNGFWVDESFTSPTAVPVIFNNPEQIFEKKFYPSYLITRNSPEPDMARWHSVGQLEYRVGVPGTVSGGGFSQVEIKAQAWPYNIFYTLSCYARYEHEALPMMKRLMTRFQHYGRIVVRDSRGEERGYSAYAETGVQDISEFIDTADRLKAYSLDLRVEAELDVNDPVIRDTVGSIKTTVEIG